MRSLWTTQVMSATFANALSPRIVSAPKPGILQSASEIGIFGAVNAAVLKMTNCLKSSG